MKPAMRISIGLLVAGAAACGTRGGNTEGGRQGDTAASAPAAATGMRGMGGMQGMQAMGDSGMMAGMESQMQAMHDASGDSIKAMLPMHRQMAANMIAQMNGQMRQMDMQPDAAWTATVDSLRQDLVRMPDMGTGELQAFMPAHMERMQRLMQMHRPMMAGGKM